MSDPVAQSVAFLKDLQDNQAKREQLFQAVLESIVDFGKKQGFDFTPDAIDGVAAITYKVDNVWHPPR